MQQVAAGTFADRRDDAPPPHRPAPFTKPLSTPIPIVVLDAEPRPRPAAVAVKPARRGRPLRAPFAILSVFAVLAGALLVSLLAEGGRGARLDVRLLPDADRLLTLAGFGIDQVTVAGHRFTPDGDIFDALDLRAARTLPALDKAAVRARIEALPWVDTAAITSVWPGGLDIRIRERRAAFVWARGGREFLIDKTGRVLAAIPAGSAPTLARVAGEGAAPEAMALFTTLERFAPLAERVQYAERVAERRWTLHLSGNVVVHLPPEREAAALATLGADERLRKAIDKPNRIVDLRTPGRAAVRAQSLRTSHADVEIEP